MGDRGPYSIPLPPGSVFDHQNAIQNQMAEFKRRQMGPRPEQFDMAAALNQMGGPPQRAPLPQRPEPDRSAGSVIGQLLAGASDVFGAAGGRQTGNLERMQGLQRQQGDQRYQDSLRQAAAEHENAQQGWQFQLSKLGLQQGTSDRAQQNFNADREFGMREDDRVAQDIQRRMENLRMDRRESTEDSRYGDMQSRLNRGEALEASRYADRKPGMDFALEAGRAREGREQEMHSFQMDSLKRQYGGGDLEKYKALVGASIGITPNKEAAASDLISKIDPNDPNAAAKMQAIREALRRATPKDNSYAKEWGTGFWGDVGEIESKLPLGLNLPYHITSLFANDDIWNSPEQQNQRGIEEQMRKIKALRAQGIPMEGFGPSR